MSHWDDESLLEIFPVFSLDILKTIRGTYKSSFELALVVLVGVGLSILIQKNQSIILRLQSITLF